MAICMYNVDKKLSENWQRYFWATPASPCRNSRHVRSTHAAAEEEMRFVWRVGLIRERSLSLYLSYSPDQKMPPGMPAHLKSHFLYVILAIDTDIMVDTGQHLYRPQYLAGIFSPLSFYAFLSLYLSLPSKKVGRER